MSAGRASQVAACFSVDRTKYLMFSKSMPDRSAPQFGMGLRSNSFRPFSRRSSIHWGSFFLPEMSRTPSWARPRRAAVPATSESAQPNLYRSRPSSSGCAVVVIRRCLRFAVRLWSGAGIQERRCGDVRGADPIAVRDGGQPLHGGTEEPGERLRLRLAQLGELSGHVRHRAVMLAQLLAPPGARARVGTGAGAGRAARGGRVAVRGQRLGQGGNPAGGRGALHHRAIPPLQVGDLTAGGGGGGGRGGRPRAG